MQGLGYPIWIKKPDKIDITKDQFYQLSYTGVASLFCSWGFVFHYDDNDNLIMYTHRLSFVERCLRNIRFKDIKWFENERAEMYFCTIPKDSRVFNIIVKNFKDLVMT